jgi:hypothetical protein
MNVGIKLYKKSAFAFNGEINHHASFKVIASTLIESVATFVAYIGAEQFFSIYHIWIGEQLGKAPIVLQSGAVTGVGIFLNSLIANFLI